MSSSRQDRAIAGATSSGPIRAFRLDGGKPMDKEAAFAAIAEDLELPLVLHANLDPRVRLAMLDKVGAALMSTNLTFRDLAERVTAPRPAAVQPSDGIPMPTSPRWPSSEILVEQHVGATTPARPVTAETMLSNEDLRRLGGYRTPPGQEGYGHDNAPIPGADGVKQGEG